MKNPLLGAGSREGKANGQTSEEQSISDVDALLDLVRRTGDAEDIFKNVEVLGAASKADYGRVREQLKDAADVNLNLLDSAVREARDELSKQKKQEARKARREEAEGTDVPTVQLTGRPSEDVVDDLTEAVEKANNPPTLFRRGDQIVRPETDVEGRVRLKTVEFSEFDDRLSRVARCVNEDFEPSDPVKRLVKRVQSVVDVPPLVGVTQAPYLRSDGSVVSEPGYDEETGLLYRPAPDMPHVTVPEEPTNEDLEEARRWVRQPWIDHPFVNEASWTNTLALNLSNLVRPLLKDANIPVAVVDSPTAGSGKDLLAQNSAVSSTGKFPGTMSNPSSDDEWRKQITAQLKKGERFVLVSDVTGTLDNAPLRRFVTTPWWSDRILQMSKQVQLRADAVWCVTGNNLRPSGDMVRRCYLIRIDPEMERPELREDFKYQQPEWTYEHRAELAAALLTLARAWVVAGRPEPDTPTLGSFEEWCRVVGGILQYAGYEDFLGNQGELRDTEFSEDNRWSMLLESIYEWQEKARNGEPFTTRDLAGGIKTFEKSRKGRGDSLIGTVIERLPERIQRKVSQGDPFAQSLGRTFSYRTDRRFPCGLWLESVEKGREGTLWKVRQEGEHNGPGQDTSERQPTSDTTRSDVSDAPF